MNEPADQPDVVEQLRAVGAQLEAAAPPYDVDPGWEPLNAKARGLRLLRATDPGSEQ